jgi:hypothetical protein
MHDECDAEWVRPKPARDAIVSVLTEVTEIEAETVDELDTYLDPDALRAVV